MLDQIVTIVLEVEDIKKSRAESLRLNNWQKLNMVVGSAGKTLRKIVGANKNDTDKPNTVQARSA